MTFLKTINLTTYEVEYIDQREPKPRTTKHETVVIDGGRISALNRLGVRPTGWLIQQFSAMGFTVTNIQKGELLSAEVDLTKLYYQTVAANAEKAGNEVAAE